MSRFISNGMSFAILSALIWSLFPVVITMSFAGIPALWSAAVGTFISTWFFLIVVLLRGEWKQKISATCKKQIFIACVLIGAGYYTTQYIGTSLTTPGNAAIVSLMEIFFSYFFISVLGKHEKLVLDHVLGSAFMVIGSLFILIPGVTGGFHAGDLIILFGSMLPPLGNLAMQRARKEVSAAVIMFWRSLVGSAFLGMLAYVIHGPLLWDDLVRSLPILLVTGLVLLGFSKILWIEAIHRLPITQIISLTSAQPLLTMLFAMLLLGVFPEKMQFLSLPPIIIGLFLLTRKKGVSKVALEEA